MKNDEQIHDCNECSWKKKVVVEKIDQDDIDVYETIMTGISTAQVARSQVDFPRENVTKEMMNAYFSTIIEKEAHYKKLEIEWWREMMEKYKISKLTKIDVMQKQFYVCVDENGNEKIEFASIKPVIELVKKDKK
jgi:hypothetical protein